MAILKPADKIITKRKLHECWKDNPCGAGFMWSNNKTLYIRKGFMSFRKFYRTYRAMERDFPESNFAIHFRLATHGVLGPDNCHPFMLNGHNIGVMHNGILGLHVPNQYQSDTSYFCTEVLSHFPKGWLYNSAWVGLVKKYAIEELSKFIIMDNWGYYLILNEEAGEWVDGIWYSNKNYFGFRKLYSTYDWENEYGYNSSRYLTGDVECALCYGKFPYQEIKWWGGHQLCSDCYEYQVKCDKEANRLSNRS
jgi:predicted glutamine amidotransferase